MTTKLHAAQHVESTRNALIEKAIQAGFGRAVVPAILDFLIAELADAPEVIQTRTLSNGPIHLNLDKREASLCGRPVYLTRTEFRLTEYFMRKIGVVVPAKDILRDVWGKHAEDRPQYLRVYVGQIREKLGDYAIRTKLGEGYYMDFL